MAQYGAERASKRAYFMEVDGTKVLNFQFAPSEIVFKEGGSYTDLLRVGEFFPELIWVSGSTTKFELNMFVDRTDESFVNSEVNSDPFTNIRKFKEQNTRYNITESMGLLQGMARGNTSSGFQSEFFHNSREKGGDVQRTIYNMSPEFSQNGYDPNKGVLGDLEALLYFVRPKGMALSSAQIAKDGKVSIQDFNAGRFTPPPMVRYFHGSMWKEGYIMEVDYRLTVMNKLLVPRRMEARIVFGCTKWGYLNELNLDQIKI